LQVLATRIKLNLKIHAKHFQKILIKLPGVQNMIKKIIELVLSFYKFAGSQTKNALKTYQTVREQIHKLDHEIEHFTRNTTVISLTFLEHHKLRLTINFV
jgi:archaellum component FlaC